MGERMSEYKRLTERDEYGNADIIGVDSSNWQFNLTFEELVKVTNALNTFAKLEDKIENGTFIEAPCKVGDIVYQFDNGGEIYELMILHINIYKGKPYYETDAIDFDNRAIGESIFLTKAEAEARLKELQEKQK